MFSQFTVVSNLVSQTGVAISHTGRRSATYHGPSKEAWILPTGWTVAMVVDTKGKTMRLLIRILLLHQRELGHSPQGCVRCYSAHVLLFSYLLLLLYCTNGSVARHGPDGLCRVCTDCVRSYIALRVESSPKESTIPGRRLGWSATTYLWLCWQASTARLT